MTKILDALRIYLHSTLDIQVKFCQWKGQSKLPFFLTDHYSFYETSILSKPCLLMIDKSEAEPAPATVRKHREQVQKHWSGHLIYVQAKISAYNRKRLIEQGVPFVVPGNQMYLPDLGIDLREYYRKPLDKAKEFFSPATQAVIIHILIKGMDEPYTPSTLGKELGYTLMTMSRVFNELEAAGIGKTYRRRRERLWQLTESKCELWEKVRDKMRSPVKKHIWVTDSPTKNRKFAAGLSALSHYSSLNPPKLPTFAIDTGEWKAWKELGIEELASSEEANIELEIWHYNPSLFANRGIVDPFSLYLSLKTNKDERVESALEEMMEEIKW